jgi:hypothetical protein
LKALRGRSDGLGRLQTEGLLRRKIHGRQKCQTKGQ